MKRALSIAGSDCSGGAGIQADLKTFSAHGVFGMSVIVSVVAENTEKVIDVQDISEDMIKKQIEAVFEDIGVDAVKIGMLSNPQCMKTAAEQMKHYKPLHIVVKNGCPLMDPSSIDTLVNTIIPIADIITPNIPEAEKIINSNIQSIKEMEDAAKRIYDMGCKAVVIKGGHHMGSAIDVLYDGKELSYFDTKRIDTKNTHGTGCTFSSAITALLAKGFSTSEAVNEAKKYITGAIQHSLELGKGNGPTNHFYDLYRRAGIYENEL